MSDKIIEKLTSKIESLETEFTRLQEQLASNRKKEEELVRYLEALFNSTKDGILMIGSDRRVAMVNAQFGELFGVNTDRLVGMDEAKLQELVTDRFKKSEEFERNIKRIRSKASMVFEDVVELEKPYQRFIQTYSAPVSQGRQYIGRIWMLRDVTNRTKLEQSIITYNQELEVANRELEQANLKIKEADRLKSEFLANMSHELRTPLNSIMALSGILLARMDGDLTGEQEKQIKIIKKSGQNLLWLINDILNLSKIESGRLELIFSEYSIQDLINSVNNTINPLIDESGLSYELDIEKGINVHSTDENKLRQILLNLLSNAVKFTETGTVTLRIRRTKFDGVLEFSVSDTGIGISPEDLKIIFDEFRQIDGSSTRKYGGTGLGLAITKKLIELLGGRLWVESELGNGTTFSFVLPAKEKTGRVAASDDEINKMIEETRSREADVDEVVDPEKDPDKLSVLVVDDNREAIYIMQKYLQASRFQVFTARDGEEAIEKALRLQPDIITLDIMIPRKDGWEVIRALRKTKETEETPIVIVSMLNNKKLAFTLGATDYIVKPVKQEALLKRLEKLTAPKEELRKILVVDDDLTQAEFVEEILATEDYLSEIATSGEMALNMIGKKQYDLVILDLLMPEVDGFDVMRKMSNSPATKNTPVIILTGKTLTRDDKNRLSDSSYELFQKESLSPVSLLDQIHRILLERKVMKDKKILIVEDNPENLYIVTYIVKKLGCGFVSAGDGLEAIKVAIREQPDLILMDINLPTLSGYETTKKLREIPEFKNTPIIAVTALSMTGDQEKALEAGCTDYVSKPLDPFRFMEKIKEFLSAV